MLKRRILYFLCLIGCFVFYIAYRRWLSWLILLTAITLPFLSLLLSLPFMMLLKGELISPSIVTQGRRVPIQLRIKSLLCATWKFQILPSYSNVPYKLREDEEFIAEHCGLAKIELKNAWCYDFLGLFRKRLPKNIQTSVLIWPKPLPIADLPALKQPRRWKVINNGFSENYDIRFYREGDELQRIHWKLSAKTGKLVFREPIVPIRTKPILILCLTGTADDIDRKLGRLLYLSEYLLKKDFAHELHYSCADGIHICNISNAQDLNETIKKLLCTPISMQCAAPVVSASWQYHIGGEPDEP